MGPAIFVAVIVVFLGIMTIAAHSRLDRMNETLESYEERLSSLEERKSR